MLKNPVSVDDHIQGEKNAAITLVEYGDYDHRYSGLVEFQDLVSAIEEMAQV